MIAISTLMTSYGLQTAIQDGQFQYSSACGFKIPYLPLHRHALVSSYCVLGCSFPRQSFIRICTCCTAFLQLNLVSIFFNVGIIICCCYVVFNSLVVFCYICCISVLTLELNLNSQPLTFVFQLQAQCTTYAFIGPLIFGNQLCLYKNSINDHIIQLILPKFLLSLAFQTYH